MLPEGIELAKQRRTALAALIVSDPEAALAQRVPESVREQLPDELLQSLETVVAGSGLYSVLAICGTGHATSDDAEPELHQHTYRHDVIIGDAGYEARIYGARRERLTEENASLFGIALDGQIALHAEDQVTLAPRDAPASARTTPSGAPATEVVLYRGTYHAFANAEERLAWEKKVAALEQPDDSWLETAAGEPFNPGDPPTSTSTPPVNTFYNQWTGRNSHQLGPKTVMVIVVKPSDGSGYGASPPTRSALLPQLDEASAWYYEQSYRQTWFGNKTDAFGDVDRLVVTTELSLPGTIASYMDFGSNFPSVLKAAVEAQGGEWTNNGPKDPDRFDRWVVMCKDKLVNSTGLAQLGGKLAWLGSSLRGGVAYHEWGHNWGVYHANYWTGNQGIPRNSAGVHTEYGDGADIMGGSGPFNPLFKERIGFLYGLDGDIVTLTNTGSHTVRIFDHTEIEADKTATRTRAVKVPITGTGSFNKFLMLGFRHSNATSGSGFRNQWEDHAIQIHANQTSAVYDENDGSHFLDTRPGSRPTADNMDRDDGALRIGRTYSEPANLNGTSLYGAVHVTPVARGTLVDGGVTHAYMDVVVNLGNFSANAAPSVTLTPSTTAVATGQNVTLTATASDPNGDTLAYSWDFGDGTFSTENEAVQTRSYAAAGYYQARVTVSDRKGGTTEAAVWINVGNQTVWAPTTPAATLSGVRYQYYTVSSSVLPNFEQLLPAATGTLNTVSLSPRQQNDDFGFVFDGLLNIPQTDVYEFTVDSKDGARMLVNGQMIINRNATGRNEASGNIALQAGLHPFRIEYFEKNGTGETLQLFWRSLSATNNQRAATTADLFRRVDTSVTPPPVVSITAPVGNATVFFGDPIAITANATSAAGIAKVLFFAGNTYLGEDTTAPYTLNWPNAVIATHSLTAIAYDTTGLWTQSAPVTVNVVSEPRNMIGLNLVGDAGTAGTLAAGDVVGAVYAGGNWNNLTGKVYGTVATLKDNSGASTAASVDWTSNAGHENFVHRANTADTSSTLGKLFRGLISARQDQGRARYTVRNIPYLEYDVYVYFDAPENSNADVNTGIFVLEPTQGPAPAPIYGRNSNTTSDGVGDYPNYDTWTGLKESTATTSTAPLTQIHGNYVVFRSQTSQDFALRPDRVNAQAYHPAICGIQIVQSPVSIPRIVVTSANSTLSVSETGQTDTLSVRLSLPPTSGSVAVNIDGSDQLRASPNVLVFDAQNYDQPQTVTFAAINDAIVNGTRTVNATFTPLGLGNYAAATAQSRSVTIFDDDQVTINAAADGVPAEAGPVAARFILTRAGASNYGSTLTVPFTLSGTAATNGSDYAVSGSGVTYNTSNGTGTVTFAANSASAQVVITPVNDTADEGTETVVLTLQSVAPHLPGTATAQLNLLDNDRADLFTQRFGAGQLETTFDLANKTLTFTPDGSPSFYQAALTTATVFPESTAGHTAWTSPLDDGSLTVNQPFVFYGTTYNAFYINSNGEITFGAAAQTYSVDYAPASHTGFMFYLRRIAGQLRDLAPNSGGSITYQRITTPGQERTIVTFTDVPKFNSTTEKTSFQIVGRDDGVITITWLGSNITDGTVGLSRYAQSTLPSGFTETNLSDSGQSSGSTNTPPAFASIPVTAAVVSTAYSYRATATDLNGNTLTFTAPVKPAWLSLTNHGDGSATLSGTPLATGDYAVTLAVSDGTATTQQSFTLRVSATVVNSAPVILTQPTSAVAAYNEASGFVVIVNGTAPFTYQWRFNGSPLSDNANYSGTQTAVLSIPRAGVAQEGNYTVTITNPHGNATSSAATLEVNDPIAPVITVPPVEQSVVSVASVTLSAAATGSRDLAYQWIFGGMEVENGGTISGAQTPTLSISSASKGNDGLYSVRVTNDGGSATSPAVRLFVNAPPSITLTSPASSSVVLDTLGRSLLLAASVTDDTATPTVAWTQVSGPAGGSAIFANAAAAETAVTFDTAGNYLLRLTANDGILSAFTEVTVYAAVPAPGSPTAPDGQVLYYPFNDNLADAQSTNNATLTGTGSSYIDGQMGRALRFTAATTHANSASGVTISNTQGFTAAAYIRADSFGTANRNIVQQLDASGTGRLWLGVNPTGGLYTFIGNTTTTGSTLVANQWYHVAVTAGNGTVRLYVDGIQVVQATVTAEACAGVLRFGNGKTPSTNAQFLGAIDDFRTFNRVLSAAEVATVAAFKDWTPPNNQLPVVNAGNDAATTTGTALQLSGSATDDGKPLSPGTLAYQWSVIGSAGGANFSNSTALSPTVTFTQAGTYTLQLAVTDGDATVVDTVVITITASSLTPAETWTQTHFGTTQNTGNASWTADPDGDGMPNLIEYALGGLPTTAGGTTMPVVQVSGVSPQSSYLTVNFRRIADPTLTYEVWASTDLVNWGSAPIWTSTGAQNTAGEITITDPAPMSENPRRFLRLRIVR